MSDYLKQRQTGTVPEKEKKVYRLKRTPLKKKQVRLKRTAIKKKFYRLPKVSEKQKKQNKIYSERRLVFLAANPKCQCGREGCNRKAVEIHHAKGRVGANFLDEKTWRAVARVCHRWAEMNPNEAKKAGLSENRL